MEYGFMFFFNSLLLGAGLAMDAFSVSLANGLNEPDIKVPRAAGIAGLFALFQGLMPLLGWVCVHTVVQCFAVFGKLVPWIALALLSYIGAKMLLDGIRGQEAARSGARAGFTALLVQGVATSIDALSVGFTIAEYTLPAALLAALLIAAVTFGICFAGVIIGKTVGTRLAGKAGILGGVILILIGIEIFITGVL